MAGRQTAMPPGRRSGVAVALVKCCRRGRQRVKTTTAGLAGFQPATRVCMLPAKPADKAAFSGRRALRARLRCHVVHRAQRPASLTTFRLRSFDLMCNWHATAYTPRYAKTTVMACMTSPVSTAGANKGRAVELGGLARTGTAHILPRFNAPLRSHCGATLLVESGYRPGNKVVLPVSGFRSALSRHSIDTRSTLDRHSIGTRSALSRHSVGT